MRSRATHTLGDTYIGSLGVSLLRDAASLALCCSNLVVQVVHFGAVGAESIKRANKRDVLAAKGRHGVSV